MDNQKKSLNPYLVVILSFVIIIFIGAVLLMMPFATHKPGNFMDSLFLATSATCVTGLNSFKAGIGDTAAGLKFPGQLILMLLIQVGGLGFITLLTFIITLFYRKLQFKDRLLLSVMVNSEEAAEVVHFVRKIILISFSFEAFGFLLGLPVFLTSCKSIPEGIWYSIFHSVSAYNNAGFDLFGSTSLARDGNAFLSAMPNWAYYYMCSYIMFLIVAGGISFVVIMDVFAKRKFKQLRVFTKISLMMTGILLLVGFLVFLFSGGLPNPFDALFQSVTCRTAGFATVNQDNLSDLSKAFSCFLMFFGGNPLGTAGGVKTTTLYIIVLAMICYVSGRKVTSFHRRYSNEVIVKAMSLVLLAVATIFVSFILLYAFEGGLDVNAIGLNHSTKSAALIYEVFSAFGTVGVTTGVTPYLSMGSKIVIIVLMFIGRLGPITFFQLLGSKMRLDDKTNYRYVEEEFLIG